MKRKPARNVPWTNAEKSRLEMLVDEAMAYVGYVDFDAIGVEVGRSGYSCEAMAYKLQLEYTQDKKKLSAGNGRELTHQDGRRVFYG